MKHRPLNGTSSMAKDIENGTKKKAGTLRSVGSRRLRRADTSRFSSTIFPRHGEKLLNEAARLALPERKVETLQWVKERHRLSLPLRSAALYPSRTPPMPLFFFFHRASLAFSLLPLGSDTLAVICPIFILCDLHRNWSGFH